MADVGLWATLSYRDAEAAMTWLKAIGFTENEVYRDEQDPTNVLHAEYLWSGGGGIMFGSFRENPEWPKQPGTGAAYLVSPDPDAVHRAALDAGGTSLRAPRDEDYGGRACAVTDPEGNIWSIGTYGPG